MSAQSSSVRPQTTTQSPWWLPLADASVAVWAFYIATAFFGYRHAASGDAGGFVAYFFTTAVSIVVLSYSKRLYHAIPRYFGIHDAVEIFQIVVFAVGLGCLSAFIVHRMDAITRSVIVVHGCLLLFFMLSVRAALRQWAQRTSRKAKWDDVINVLVVGVGPMTVLYLDAVSAMGRPFLRIAGVIAEHPGLAATKIRGQRVLGSIASISKTIQDLANHGVPVHRIVVAQAQSDLEESDRAELERATRSFGVELEYLNELLGIPSARRAEITDPVQIWGRTGESLANLYPLMRRTGDLAAASLLILLLAPFLALSACLVMIDVGWPVLFWQERPGRFGVPFRLYKFKTMADPIDANGQPRPEQTRTGLIGEFMRRYRFDELPQLFNVLNGSMSLVGPRPLLVVDQPADVDTRLSVRPGITGWAQVNGGRVITVAEKTALDIWYTEHASIALDIKVIFLTVRMLLMGDARNQAAVDEAMAAATSKYREAGGATLPRPPRHPRRALAQAPGEEIPAKTGLG